MTQPTIGRIVHYTLSGGDAVAIANQRRATGASANAVENGQTYPAVVVRDWGSSAVNLQVLLDGNDTFWATSRLEGDTPGTWAWPAKVAGSR